MTYALPTLTFRKTKELLLLNVSCSVSTFSPSMAQYHVRKVMGVAASEQLLRLLQLSKTDDVPYAIIADYSMLAGQDFAFSKAFQNNILTAHVPIIAIAEKKEDVQTHALKNGIDDCYFKPVDCRDMCERIEFLHSNKSRIVEADERATEILNIKVSPFKRILDIAIASVCIFLLSPVLILTALFIRLESRGPIIYRSKRSGTGYQVFDFLKFRSMYFDADKRLDEIQHLNQYKSDIHKTTFVKVKNDPRITKVGRFIRKTSIDELPQLFNVIKGDMSIVGNRPLPLYEAECLTKEDWAYRFIAPAGITGLWQVTKRGTNDMSAEERIDLDVTYAKNNSFWYDLKILMKTPFAIIQKENV